MPFFMKQFFYMGKAVIKINCEDVKHKRILEWPEIHMRMAIAAKIAVKPLVETSSEAYKENYFARRVSLSVILCASFTARIQGWNKLEN